MKRVLILFVLTAFLLSGCSGWLDGEYHSVKPHMPDTSTLSNDAVNVTGYQELRDALTEMVTTGRQNSVFYMADIALEQIDQYMCTAIMHVLHNCAIGAYAVEEISYESGTNGGVSAISVNVTYLHGRQEILHIKNADNMAAVKEIIAAALRNCESSTVIKVEEYVTLDAEAFVREYVNENPHLCMELPQVTATVYPEQGQERVLEVLFTYQNSRETLQNMQNVVSPIFSAAKLYVQSSDGESQKYEQLYGFLMERFDYKIETSITPVYSLLRYGVGDSKAIAMVYNIMCKNADLPCQVVSGTKNGEAYYWNLIQYEEMDCHVDLLACSEAGEFSPKKAEEMTGYVWDYSVYPQGISE